jgi:hypothetical protein
MPDLPSGTRHENDRFSHRFPIVRAVPVKSVSGD